MRPKTVTHRFPRSGGYHPYCPLEDAPPGFLRREECMRVLVCGGRDFNDSLTLGSWLGGVHKNHGPITLLIEGGSRGADFMARKFAEWQGIPVQTFPADWDRDGKAAGKRRDRSETSKC